MLMQPKYCSQNLTCELGKKTYIQCNANAHRIDKLKILIEDCDSLENCYSLSIQWFFYLVQSIQGMGVQTYYSNSLYRLQQSH